MHANNLLAVLICTYNKKKSLLRCLQSIHEQTVPPNHIVVVEKISEFPTISRKELRSLFKNTVRVTYVTVRNVNISASRNIAIKHATEDLLLFVDDDVLLDRTYIEKLLDYYKKNPSYSVIVGRIISSRTGYWDIFAKKIHTSYAADEFKNQTVDFWPTMNMSFRRFIGVSFDERYSAMEDLDFCMRLKQRGYNIYYFPRLCCTHEYISTFTQFVHKFSHYFTNNLSLLREEHPKNYVSEFPQLDKHSILSYVRLLRFYIVHSNDLRVYLKLPPQYYFACLTYHWILYKAVYFDNPRFLHHNDEWHSVE